MDSSAVASVADCSIGFALNFDIITRTSLHNGYKLFQQARVVDMFLRWRKRDIARALNAVKRQEDAAKMHPVGLCPEQVRIANAVQAAVNEAAASLPAQANPFAVQHPIARHIYPIVAAAGGVAPQSFATVPPVGLSAMRSSFTPCAIPEAPAPRWKQCF